MAIFIKYTKKYSSKNMETIPKY